MTHSAVSTFDGNTFVTSTPSGDLEASAHDPSGLFSFDTRHLSYWVLTINGERVKALTSNQAHTFESHFLLAPCTGSIDIDEKLSVRRERTVSQGFFERLTLTNHGDQPVELAVRIEVASDFADLLEVKDGLAKKGNYYTRIEPGMLLIGYKRESFRRETRITTSRQAQIGASQVSYSVRIAPHDSWSTELDVVAVVPGQFGWLVPPRTRPPQQVRDDLLADESRWLAQAPQLRCDWLGLARTYRRSLLDLAALRFSPTVAGRHRLPAAGLPWFMTMLGRDSILTSLQALSVNQELAATTLRVLADWQGTRKDDFRDEDPGRIPHEMRYGELAAFEQCPHSPYYGSADATPLFVVLLDEYELWTGDTGLARELEYEARAALRWIDEYANLTGTGYLWYRTRSRIGLANQCWKDSGDSVAYQDGTLPGFPRATCELQGYAYDAKVRGARLAREVWHDPSYAVRLAAEAAELKSRFHRDFWVPEGEYYALALDAGGRRVDALSSNMGHLLWSGIVDEAYAPAVVAHLLGPRLFSGWGVRTLAEGEARYDPMGYHVGSVWPFDNALIAWGLRTYGYAAQASTLAAGILAAAEYFDGQLPDAFGGHHRTHTRDPVPYPSACRPRALSSAAPLMLLRTLVGLTPDGDRLAVDPALPAGADRLELAGVHGRWGRRDILVG